MTRSNPEGLGVYRESSPKRLQGEGVVSFEEVLQIVRRSGRSRQILVDAGQQSRAPEQEKETAHSYRKRLTKPS